MLKKILLFLVLIIFLSGVTIGCNKQFLEDSNLHEIKIGVILPLSGANASLGEGVRNAAEMALDEIKQTQKLENDYNLVFEDDQTNTTKTITALNQLFSVNNVKAVVSFASNPGNTVNPYVEKNKIIHFGVASDSNVANGYYNFIHWTQPKQEAERLLEKLKEENLTSMAMVYQSDAGEVAIAKELEKLARANNITLYQEMTNVKETNFQTILTKLQQKNPDIFYTLFYSPQLEIFGKQFRELGIDKPLTTIEAFEFSTQPELFNGYWYVSAAESTDEFRNNYQAKFGKAPSIGAANAYDIIKILVWAYENVDDLNNNELVAQKIKTFKDWPGALGSLNITEEGIIASQAALKKVVDGEFVVIE